MLLALFFSHLTEPFCSLDELQIRWISVYMGMKIHMICSTI